MTIEKKRLCVNLDTQFYETLTQMVEKYKLPISNIVNENIKTSTNYDQVRNAIDFNLFMAKGIKDFDNKIKRERRQKGESK